MGVRDWPAKIGDGAAGADDRVARRRPAIARIVPARDMEVGDRLRAGSPGIGWEGGGHGAKPANAQPERDVPGYGRAAGKTLRLSDGGRLRLAVRPQVCGRASAAGGDVSRG